MKNRDYTDLRNKTIFDFCTDEELMDSGFEFIVKDKDRYMRFVKENPSQNAFWLLRIGVNVLKDEHFVEAVEREFADLTIPGLE